MQRQEQMERVWRWLSLSFFLLVVAFIFIRRVWVPGGSLIAYLTTKAATPANKTLTAIPPMESEPSLPLPTPPAIPPGQASTLAKTRGFWMIFMGLCTVLVRRFGARGAWPSLGASGEWWGGG
jgi:hypothetical protein